MKKANVELRATNVRYFSEHDEAAFFEWLNKIDAIKEYKGKGNTVYIEVDTEAVDEDVLRELISLFHRYAVNIKQLKIFDRPEFNEWFRNDNAYWFDEIFS